MSNEENKQSKKNISFLITSLIGALSSIISSIIASAPFLQKAIPFLTKVPLMVWPSICLLLYVIISYVSSRKVPDSAPPKGFLAIPLWTQLRSFGDQRISKISYWALVIIPIIAYIFKFKIFSLPFLNTIEFPFNLKLLFFASWFFSVALILFIVGCPKEFRVRNPLENAKTINLVMNEVRQPQVIIEQNKDIDNPELDNSALEFRAICFLFFLFGFATALFILGRSAWLIYEI